MADLRTLAPQSERATHLVVVVHYGPDAPTWKVAGQNHFFEIYQSACEILGANRSRSLKLTPTTRISSGMRGYYAQLLQLKPLM